MIHIGWNINFPFSHIDCWFSSNYAVGMDHWRSLHSNSGQVLVWAPIHWAILDTIVVSHLKLCCALRMYKSLLGSRLLSIADWFVTDFWRDFAHVCIGHHLSLKYSQLLFLQLLVSSHVNNVFSFHFVNTSFTHVFCFLMSCQKSWMQADWMRTETFRSMNLVFTTTKLWKVQCLDMVGEFTCNRNLAFSISDFSTILPLHESWTSEWLTEARKKSTVGLHGFMDKLTSGIKNGLCP